MTKKEAFIIIKELHDKSLPFERDAMEVFFPELKESEDEKIRKSLIEFLESIWHLGKDAPFEKWDKSDCSKWIAWLENQGKQKPPVIDFKANNWYVSKVDGKIYDMTYNPTVNIEPKFEVGDWIAWEELNTAKIVNIDGDRYEVEFIDGNKGFPHIDYIDRLFHLWTIRDARDGDVLASDNSIFIFQEEYIAEKPIAYCGLMNGIFIKGGDACWSNEKYHPATNEQCETLFKAMHEAGYEWDAEKKELSCQEVTKKCEQDKWSEEDEYLLGETIQHLEQLIRIDKAHHCACDVQYYQRDIDWLKSIKERVHPKSQWTDEDEIKRDLIYNALNSTYDIRQSAVLNQWLNCKLKAMG